MSYLSNLCPMTARFKEGQSIYIIVSRAISFFYFENRLVCLRLYLDIGHVMTKID